jgi:hypothetical protein
MDSVRSSALSSLSIQPSADEPIYHSRVTSAANDWEHFSALLTSAEFPQVEFRAEKSKPDVAAADRIGFRQYRETSQNEILQWILSWRQLFCDV